ALLWAAKLSDEDFHEPCIRDLVHELAIRGWMDLSSPEVLHAMATYCRTCLRAHHDIVATSDSRFAESKEKRRCLAELIVPDIDDFDGLGTAWIYIPP